MTLKTHLRLCPLLALTCRFTHIVALSLAVGLPASIAQATEEPKPTALPALDPALPKNSHGWTAIVDGKPVAASEMYMGDEVVIRSILDEGKNRNKVMDHLMHLCTVIGPRLTASTQVEQANNWCKQMYESWGLTNVVVEEYGTASARFDRGPSSARVMLKREKKRDDDTIEIEYDKMRDCEFSTLSWAAGTDGLLRGHIVKAPKDNADFERIRPTLKGAWVLLEAPPAVGQRGIRGRLGAMYDARKDARKKVAEGKDPAELSIIERLALEEVAGYISTSRDERVWTGAIPNWRQLEVDDMPKDVHVQVRLSDYDFINSRLADGETVAFEADLKHTLVKGPIPLYNTIAEIRGTELPDEVIIVSAHLDSWDGPGSQGCTDNGTGSAVTLEAARILAVVGAKPRRTIRFINWTGEEQGLLGSAAWVKANTDKLDKVSAAFVDDGGTNYQGGIPAADNMVEMLAAATAPTNYQFYSETDKSWLNVNIKKNGKRNPRGGGSDHASFNRVGVPGFFWDEVGRATYSYGWHTQHDTIALAIPEYLIQSATNTAITAYRLACAPSLLPREIPEEPKKEEATPTEAKPAEAKPAEPAPAPTGS